MKYKADITAGALKVPESRVIADLLLRDLSDEQWRKALYEENVLQTRSPKTAKRLTVLIRGRLTLVEAPLWRLIRDGSGVEGTFQRVRQGRRGDLCMRIQADDAEAMKERVFKWTHPISEIVQAPGTYVLSYEVRVVGNSLSPKHSMGSFNSYLHMRSEGNSGGNVGQRPSMITDTGERWVRREFVIDVPPGVSPTTLSLQLHCATGSVLFDNVCLVRYIEQVRP